MAASPARSCPRTSSPAARPTRSRRSSPGTPGSSRCRARGRGSRLRVRSRRSRGRPAALDLRRIRDDPESARAALARRGAADALDEVLALDARRRALLPEVEERRARQRRASEGIADAKRSGGDAEPLIAEMRGVAAELKRLEGEFADVDAGRDALAAELPNLPEPEAPDGDAVTLREVGERPSFAFEARDHLELGLDHGWIEMDKAAAASGSRFAYLLGDLVLVELALIRLAVERTRAEGFVPVVPPVLVR